MALAFDGSTSGLSIANRVIPNAYPFSMFGWVKSTNPVQTAYVVGAGSPNGNESDFLAAVSPGNTGTARATMAAGGGNGSVNSAANVTNNVWLPLLVVFNSATSVDVYYGSGAKVNGNSGYAPDLTKIQGFAVGMTFGGFGKLTGEIAELAVWNIGLVQADYDALAAGAIPKTVQTANCTAAWSLLTQAATQVDEIGGKVLTGGATTTQASVHPITRTADTTAPTVTAAAVANSSPTVVALTASEAMSSATPAASAFTVSGHTVQSVSVSGTVINLTVTPAFANGEAARTVGYTKPGTNNAADTSGNQLDNFTGLAITNNVAPAGDTTPPGFASAQVANSQPGVILVTMNETLASSLPPNSAFTASGGRTVTGVSINGTLVSVTVNTPYAYGNTITIAYTQPGANPRLQDASGNLTASFTAKPVTNGIAAPGASGTITWPLPIAPQNGGPRLSAGHRIAVCNMTTDALVVKKTGLTTHASTGLPPAISDALIVAGTQYRCHLILDSDNTASGTEVITAT